MKRCIPLFIVVFGLLLCCRKPVGGPEQPVLLESERGAVAIQFTGAEAEKAANAAERSAFPSTVFDAYTYTFTKMAGGAPSGAAQAMVPSADGFFYLELGDWKVDVNAYVGAAIPANLAATGEKTFTVAPGTNNITVGLVAAQSSGTGIFTFTVGVPSGTGIVRFNLTKLPDTAVAFSSTPAISGNAISGTETLPDGFYQLEIILSNSGGLAAGVVEVVRIFPKITTEYTKTFTADDFSLRTITITYNLNSFPGTAPGTYTAVSGMAIGAGALPALTVSPAKYDSLYIWRGWATTANGNVIDENATFTANQTLYAVYTPPHNGALVNGDFTGTDDAWGWEANDPDVYNVNTTWGPSGGAAASLSVWGEDSAVNLNLYQHIRNLETGSYTLSAKVIGTGYTSATNMYARTYSGASPATATTAFTSTNGSTWVTISIANINVTDGYLTAGFNVAAPAQTWIGVAHVTLVKQQPVTAINIAAIPGVTAPATGATPVTAITETAQYTGTVAWSPAVAAGGTFAASTTYTATITLTAKTGFTLQGVAANFFTVAGSSSRSNSANSGVVTAAFPATNPQAGIVFYWVDANDEITVSPNPITISPSGSVTLTPNGTGYTGHRWYVNGVFDGSQTGGTYTFSAAGKDANKNYTVTLTVQKGGKWYNTNIIVRVQ